MVDGTARYRVEHLGCKVNAYEAEALAQGLERLGLQPAGEDETCDVYVLNSCSVTGHAGATSRKQVRRAHRRDPHARLLVTGCYAVSDRDLVQALPGVAAVFGNDAKESILPWVAREVLGLADVEALPLRITRSGQTRAFVKIQDGCDDRCTFCIIPRLRGPARSRPTEAIVAEVEDLVRSGHLEVVLTGVHLGYFGKESGDRRRALRELCAELLAVPGLARLKLSSLEVHEITDELLDLLASAPNFAPHFHLPLQAGSDAVLRAMRRKYDARRFREKVAAIRARFVQPALATDVIVGYPTETEEHFEETMRLVEEAGFMKVHVFPFSARESTAAAELPPLAASAVEARKQRLLDLEARLRREWLAGFVGRELQVLVEGRRTADGRLTGLTERYQRVSFAGPDRLMGELLPVRALELDSDGEGLRGEVVARGVRPESAA